jgi:hypothetical protein
MFECLHLRERTLYEDTESYIRNSLFYHPHNIVRYVARMGEMRSSKTFCSVKLKGRNHVGGQGEDGRITLRRIIQDLGVYAEFRFHWLRIKLIAGFCDYGNKHSGFISVRHFFHLLSRSQLSNDNPVPFGYE